MGQIQQFWAQIQGSLFSLGLPDFSGKHLYTFSLGLEFSLGDVSNPFPYYCFPLDFSHENILGLSVLFKFPSWMSLSILCLGLITYWICHFKFPFQVSSSYVLSLPFLVHFPSTSSLLTVTMWDSVKDP